jgi:dTDP-4-amino-4,6-dideoxygalactose transaminase
MSKRERILFLDLVTPHQELEAQLTTVFQKALRTASFVGGPLLEQFEREFASFCATKQCVGVASGTDAVRFALMACGVQPGDVVITVPHTFIATAEAISQAGARVDFVDIDEHTYCMDPEKLREYFAKECYVDPETGVAFHRKLRAPVTAVVPVHLYGHTADMDSILQIARRYKLTVIEDACQAHGAEFFSEKDNCWKKAGSMGHAAAFSFYPGKNLGACGEGGAVTTNNEDVARKIRMLRDHGQSKKYHHDIEGYNGRLDSIQAGILSVKLTDLAKRNDKRRLVAGRYDRFFSTIAGVAAPQQAPWSRGVYHLYVIRVQDREGLQKALSEAGIDTGIHYPVPLHLQNVYEGFKYRAGDFPVTETIASEILSLPMYPELRPDQQERVVSEVSNFILRQSAKNTQKQNVPVTVPLI